VKAVVLRQSPVAPVQRPLRSCLQTSRGRQILAGRRCSLRYGDQPTSDPFLPFDLPDTGHSEQGKRTFTVTSGAVRAHRIGIR
jgi:hypothetical protein